MSYEDFEDKVSRNWLDRFNIQSLFVGVFFQNYLSQPEIFSLKKTKYNLRNTVFDESGATQLENVGTQSKQQNPESSKDMHTGLTQELQTVSVKEFFHVALGTVLFPPGTADNLYRARVLENYDQYTKIRYLCWGSEHNSWFNSKSIWACPKFKEQLDSCRKINTDLSNKLDNLLVSCDSSQLNN